MTSKLFRLILLLISILLILFLAQACNLPIVNNNDLTSFDEAHLLMITSRGLLDLYSPPPDLGQNIENNGVKLIDFAINIQVSSTLEQMNQQMALAKEYQRLAQIAREKGNDVLADTFLDKAEMCLIKAEKLEDQRANWRRNRRFNTVIRRNVRNLGQGIGRTIDFVMTEVGENVEARINDYIAEIKFLLHNPLRYGFDQALTTQLMIIKNQFQDELGPFFGQRAYELLGIDETAWAIEGQIFNNRKRPKPTATSTEAKPPVIGDIQTNPTEETINEGMLVISDTHGPYCDEAEGTFAYTWQVNLIQRTDTGDYMGTIKYHNCPGGGRVAYHVVGEPQEGAKIIMLSGTKKDGGGELYEKSLEYATFYFDLENGQLTDKP